MPKDNDSSRSASRRRSKASGQDKAKEREAINGVEGASASSNVDRSLALRLSSSGVALQRFADLAQLFSSPSFLNDLDDIERDYGREIDKMKEVESLNQVITKLTHTRSEEVDDLRTEIARLQTQEAACRSERESCQKMRADMQADKATADAERKQLYEKKVQEDKAKAKKELDTKKAEMEAEFKKQTQDLKARSQELSAEKQKLKQEVVELQQNAKERETSHKWEMLGLKSEHEKVGSELSQLKSEFPTGGHPLHNYPQRFLDISTAVKTVSVKYFGVLPESALSEPEDSQRGLSEQTPAFDSISLLPTEASNFVRTQIARSIVSRYLCDQIWQPFLTEGGSSDHRLNQFLDGLSKALLASGGRGESAWRVLTLRGIEALHGPSTESHKIKSILDQILGIIGPLAAAEDLSQLEKDLTSILNDSITVWRAARTDEKRFFIDIHPKASDKARWFAEDTQATQAASNQEEILAAKELKPICLFPSILQIVSKSESVVICQGSALFPNSYAWNQALLEKKENELEIRKAVQEVRSKIHARRTSFPNGPNGVPRGKLPASAAASLQNYAFD